MTRGLDRVATYEDFVKAVPEVVTYDKVRPYIMRMVNGERDVLWPGWTRNFAQSSGTSDGKSKYIPVTPESFRWSHYRGGADVVAHYLNLYPDSRIFSGKAFILGGSFANELTLPPGVEVGDLSANLIENINPLVNMFRIPSKEVALMSDWKQKLPALVNASLHENVTNISGVPSWFMTVLKEVIKTAGATTIHDVWPNLEVFFHGGISFDPYREQYRHITDPSRMRYIETYNASEGFFALQNEIDDRSMLLLLDSGTFYEFIPVEDAGDTHLVAGAEVGVVWNDKSVVGHVKNLEHAGIIEESHVHAAAVGRVMVNNLKHPFLDGFGLYEVFKHAAVLDFRHAEDSRPHRGGLGGHLRNTVGKVVNFAPVFFPVPLARALRGKFEVIFSVVIDCVEEVFKVVEPHAENEELLVVIFLGRSTHDYKKGKDCCQKKFLHKTIKLFS